MRRTVLLLAGVLLAVVALGSDSPKDYDDKTEVAGIEGTWRLIELESSGKKQKPSTQHVLTIHNGTYTYVDGEGDPVRVNCQIDPARNPPHLNIIPSIGFYQGVTIYQIKGDTLRIAKLPIILGDQRPKRPQGFNDQDVHIETYKRVK
jgi:uncharacterized protein (TIGR03067 family)